MKYYYLLLIFFSFGFTFAQTERVVIPKSWYDEKPNFVNQGEQEDFWSWQLFEKEYKYQKIERYYLGAISVKDNTFYFGKISSLHCDLGNNELKEVFLQGVFYPRILGVDHINISAFQELKFLSTNPTVKRFRFWLSSTNMMNPTVYLFEIQNENATETTSFLDFVKGANVTFIKKGWIIF